MELASIEEAVALAQRRWPGLELRIKNHHEANGPCPICHKAETDGFVLFEDGGYFCRPGDHTGWLDEEDSRLSAEERRLLWVEAEARRARREREQMQRQLTTLEQMASCTDHVQYHKLLDDSDRQWWHAQGIYDKSIDEYMLGVCYNCPTAHRQASYTIPVFDSTWTKLLNIRHRLINTTNGDRYRPHMAGLPGKLLFNARWTRQYDELLLVEGEKKSIVCSSQVMPAVGILGAGGFDMRWLPHFDKVRRLYVALDPDVHHKALVLGREIASKSKMDVRVCSFPLKPDDFFLRGGTPSEFHDFMKWAKAVN